MRIQIQIGKEPSQSYSIDKPEMVIGSSKKADIMIPLPEISRHHATLITEGEKHYLVDNGSTNGTWQNEERIEPNKKVEFTTYFPYRLAESVTISLSDEEESTITTKTSPTQKPQTTTAQGTQAIELDVKKPKAKVKKAVPVVEETKVEVGGGLAKGVLLVIILIAVGIYVYHTFN